MTVRFLMRPYLAILVPALMLSIFMPAPSQAQSQTSVLNQRQKNQLTRLSKNVKKEQQSLKKVQGALRDNKVAVKAKGAIPAKQRAQLQHDENQARHALNQLKHTKKAQGQ